MKKRFNKFLLWLDYKFSGYPVDTLVFPHEQPIEDIFNIEAVSSSVFNGCDIRYKNGKVVSTLQDKDTILEKIKIAKRKNRYFKVFEKRKGAGKANP